MSAAIRMARPSLVVLVGPSGSGKSTWAAANFDASEIVSSDQLRSMVGESQNDQRAGTDAFSLLDEIVTMRCKRGLLTVVDTLGLDPARRRAWRELALAHEMPCHAVFLRTDAKECRARNKARLDPIPARVLTKQLADFDEQAAAVAAEGFDGVHEAGPVRVVPPIFVDSPQFARAQAERALQLDFGLHISRFDVDGGSRELRTHLTKIAGAAEEAGFTSLWVMDHQRQIPQVGPAWDDLLECFTTLGFLAAATERVSLGSLVAGITYRNIAHLGKIIASLDVLSGGRAVCGLGAAWFEAEHRAYGWDFPPTSERFELLEDALELLPLLWGPGTPSFEGRRVTIPEAMCYPRPLQEPVPILIGGSGERRTLRLAARYADAVNLFGDASTVAHKVGVLHKHCQDADRDPETITVTHLGEALVGRDGQHVDELVDRLRPRQVSAGRYAIGVNAGTIDDQIGRYRALAEAGVQTAIVSLPDLAMPGAVERFAPIIAAFA